MQGRSILVSIANAMLQTRMSWRKMDAQLLKKVEELTLYVLDLKRENAKQQQEIDKLMKQQSKKEN